MHDTAWVLVTAVVAARCMPVTACAAPFRGPSLQRHRYHAAGWCRFRSRRPASISVGRISRPCVCARVGSTSAQDVPVAGLRTPEEPAHLQVQVQGAAALAAPVGRRTFGLALPAFFAAKQGGSCVGAHTCTCCADPRPARIRVSLPVRALVAPRGLTRESLAAMCSCGGKRPFGICHRRCAARARGRAERAAVEDHRPVVSAGPSKPTHTCTSLAACVRCRSGKRHTLSHNAHCARLCAALNAAQATHSRGLALRMWLGVDVAASAVVTASGAHRVAAATIVYHWARATWRGLGQARHVAADVGWVAGLERPLFGR